MDPSVRNSKTKSRPPLPADPERRILITGGAGFLGVNAAIHLVKEGWHATVLDNLSRPGTERNLKWLLTRYPHRITFIKEDVRNAPALAEHVRDQDAILHLAGQVAVTTSLADPSTDFDVNARGTLNMLEAVRLHQLDARDLSALYATVIDKIGITRGEIYNVGGGPENQRNLLEVIDQIGKLTGHKPQFTFADWREGDQKFYVSDVTKARRDLGWEPRVAFERGLRDLIAWAASVN